MPPPTCQLAIRVCDGGAPDLCTTQSQVITVEAVNDGNPFAKVSIGDQTLRKVAISAFQVKYVTDSSVAQTKSSSFGSSGAAFF